jgi:hypothetical protein
MCKPRLEARSFEESVADLVSDGRHRCRSAPDEWFRSLIAQGTGAFRTYKEVLEPH